MAADDMLIVASAFEYHLMTGQGSAAQQQDPQKPVRFTVNASWGGGN